MNIAVVEPDGAGGLAHYAFQLAEALSEAGADVTLVTSPHWELADLERSFAVEQVIPLWPAVESPIRSDQAAPLRRLWRKTRRIGRAVRYAWAWERLTRFLIQMQPDIVQFSVIHFPFQSVFLHRLRRAGLTLTQVCHEFEPRESRYVWVRRVDRVMATSVFSAFQVMFFHGEATATRFRTLIGDPTAEVRIIPHGNQALIAKVADSGGDLREHYRIASERPVVLFFGGLRPSKGLPDLIDAFAVARQEIDATLLVVGFPATEFDPRDLTARANRHGVIDDVIIDARYLPLEDVGRLLRTAAVVVLPYRSATASGVLQVAYAFGRPVIVTDVGDLPSAVEHGETGLVVPAGSIAELAGAMVDVLKDPTVAPRMGAAARQVAAERYAWDPIARGILDAYEALPQKAADNAEDSSRKGAATPTDQEVLLRNEG